MAIANPEGRTPAHESSSAAGRVAAREYEPTIGALVHDVLEDVSTLIRKEIQLAKSEVTADAKKGGMGAAFFVVAGVFAFLGLIFLLHSFARTIAVWLPVWAGYLIVAVILFIGAAIAAVIGKNQLSKVKGKPERTIVTSKETVEVVKKAAQG
ncbi:phage holin family protein [Austwickia chelonae]|uniref:phage holin family protein n=1 Tax=Austwickia chelonae TaxID=100225 RepID=UPI000E251454|nr:phage holin family protein [Austwickia chelonae]